MLKLDGKRLTLFVLLWGGSIAAAYWLGGNGENERLTKEAAQMNGTALIPGHSGVGASGSGIAESGGLQGKGSTSRYGKHGVQGAFLNLARDGAIDDLGDKLEDLTDLMSLKDVHEAMNGLNSLEPGPFRQRAMFSLLERWSKLDPGEALSYAASIAAPEERQDATRHVFSSWGEVDPGAALQFAKENSEGSGRSEIDAIFRGVSKSNDIAGAMQFMENLNEEDTPYGSRIYESIRRLYERGDKEVIAWAEKLPAGEVRERAMTAVIDQWARHDPTAAKEWLEKNGSGSKAMPSAQIELGESWARVDPTEAYAWASTLPEDSKTTAAVMDRVFYRWMQYDFENAAKHLVDVEPSPQLDRTFERYIDRVRTVNPADTMPWAESITDPERRRKAIYRVANDWKRSDKGGFEAYVRSSSSISEKDKQRLLGKKL